MASITFLLILKIIVYSVNGNDDKTSVQITNTINLILDPSVTSWFPGGSATIITAAEEYEKFLSAVRNEPLSNFDGRWKYELERATGPIPPECITSRRFDFSAIGRGPENLFFCFDTNQQDCSVYSFGHSDQWSFESSIASNTNCKIEKFDCIVNSTVPSDVISKGNFHPYCLGHTSGLPHESYKTIIELNQIVGRTKGPDYVKMFLEGWEWGVLRSFVKLASDPKNHPLFPKQMYIRLHLEHDFEADGKHEKTSFVGQRLHKLFADLFIKCGYLVVFRRHTISTRVTD
eukprot:gene9528-19815_t